VARKSVMADGLAGTLAPNQSGILALVKASDIDGVKAAMPDAAMVRTAGVDGDTAQQISAAAKQAS